jgi:flagellin FlaB
MFNDTFNSEDRGQVGIGTLIVFIALVLVAAIAAGVLINTAGFLQSQAEQTGQESTAQTANNVEFISANGTAATGSPGDVTGISLKVQLAPGSEPVDLGNGQLEVFVDGATRASGSPSSTTIEGSDSARLDIDSVTGTTITLEAGDEAVIVFTTADGSQTETTISAPDPITTSGQIRLT